jgi:hypothetical protein
VLGRDAYNNEATGKMTEMSELERVVHDKTMKDTQRKVECLCVHGTCGKGGSECSGRCLTGWSGPHCDIPDKNNLKSINDRTKDYTKDG